MLRIWIHNNASGYSSLIAGKALTISITHGFKISSAEIKVNLLVLPHQKFPHHAQCEHRSLCFHRCMFLPWMMQRSECISLPLLLIFLSCRLHSLLLSAHSKRGSKRHQTHRLKQVKYLVFESLEIYSCDSREKTPSPNKSQGRSMIRKAIKQD